MQVHNISNSGENKPLLRSLQAFIAGVGISPVTAWRFEKRGWLKTVNIAGRRYITAEAEAEFASRAAAGEFAKHHKTPKRAEVGV